MKKVYKFIHFTPVSWTDDSGNKLKGWYCRDKSGKILGRIGYYPNWRKWVYSSRSEDIIYDEQCLKDITHFLHQINKEKGETDG